MTECHYSKPAHKPLDNIIAIQLFSFAAGNEKPIDVG